MRIVRLAAALGVGFVALLSLAASAAATPGSLEFGKCEKVAEGTGAFGNSGCTKPGKRRLYEWRPLAEPVAITISKTPRTANLVLEGADGVQMTCKGEASKSGSALATELSGLVARGTECQAQGAGCNSRGESAGRVATETLTAHPGIVQKNAEGKEEIDVVGLDFRSASGEFAEFACVVPFLVRGGVIAKFPVNKSAPSLKYEYAQSLGKQIPEAFAEGPAEFLEWSVAGAPYEHAGLSFEATLKTVSKTKIELRHCEANVC